MLNTDLNLAGWIFQSVLFCILLATLVYARRLERLLRQVRDDQGGLRSNLTQIDVSVTAATLATDRLMHEAKQADAALREASETAAAMTVKLDALISRAAETLASVPEEIEARLARPSAKRPVPPRRAEMLQSQVERDLARVLFDAS
ncbi:hypothetical protein [Acidiphilium sp.]|uniref:hypothetical protein n=1 Tax=Acidiphilium sp. TaxID=527 RepID=UPI003D05731A